VTELGESTQVVSSKDEALEDMAYAGVKVCYPSGKPYPLAVEVSRNIDGSDIYGRTNFDSQCIDTLLEPDARVKYEVSQNVEPELKQSHQSIKKILKEIIEDEKAQQAMLDQQFEQESTANQGLILLGAFMTGVADGAIGLVEFAGDALEATGKVVWLGIQQQANVLEAAWEQYVEGDEQAFFDSINDKNAKDFAEIFGLTPRELAQKMALAYETFNFVMDDAETRQLLTEFAQDYAKAQSTTEMTSFAGSAVFDIILGAILAITTGGSGNAAQITAKMHHMGKFRSLALELKEFVKLAKKQKLHHKVDGKLNDIVEVHYKPPVKQRLETNDVKADSFKKDKGDPANDNNENGGTAGGDATSAGSKSGNEPSTNKAGQACSADSKTCTGGEPISLVTGEEMLPLVDFAMEGPLPLAWERKYKSSNPDNIGLGHGWTHPLADTLLLQGGGVELHNAEARIIHFSLPAAGGSSHNTAEKLSLKRLSDSSYSLTGDDGIERRFTAATASPRQLYLSEMRDPFGNGYRLSYERGRLQQIDSDHGDSWQLHYNEQNLIGAIEQQSANGKRKTLVRYAHDEHLDLVCAEDALGNREHYAYYNHLLTRRTTKSGYSFHLQWDGNSPSARCIRNWGDPINGQATYDYRFVWDKARHRVAITDTRGGEERYQFNERGLPVYHRDAEGGETFSHYDDNGNLIEQIDAEGKRQKYLYDNQQKLQTYVDRQGQQQRFFWDENGNLSRMIDPEGQSWWRQYNKLNQLVGQTNPLGERHRYEYNQLGLVSSITNPEGKRWHYIWDNRARLSAVRNPLGQHSRYRYNEDGRLTGITWPDGKISHYAYDANGNCIAIKTPNGQTTRYDYSPLGLLKSITDHSGRNTQYQYNGLSQVVRRIDPSGQTLNYHYDGERNLVGLTNEKGERYQLKYDLNERLVGEIGFDGRVQRYAYNRNGHLQSSEDYSPDGKQLLNQVHYQRDAQGRLLQQIDGRDQSILNQFSYDPIGRLIAAKNPHRQLQWRYDPLGRVIEDRQDQHVIKHRYDRAGVRIESRVDNADIIRYGFDDNGAFNSLSYNEQSIAHIERDNMGRETQRHLGNQLTTEHHYDPQGRLQRQATFKTADTSAPSISDRSYHYNEQGLLSQIDDARRGSTFYHYDPLDRLAQVKGPNPENFIHDPAGNILSSQQETEEVEQVQGNRLAFHGDAHYDYDARGNRIAQKRGKAQKLVSEYRYNALNQLTNVLHKGIHTQYAYDPLGRRIVKANQQSHTDFLWLEDNLLSEVSQSRSADSDHIHRTQKTYLFEPGSFKPLAFVQDGETYHYHLDHLGTPQEITNGSGEVVWAVSYKAYGNLAVAHEQQIENNLRFQGQYYDSETGLHYNRFRYYDPGAGRFINQDPIGLLGGLNNYQYVPNPVGWVDPFGLSCKEGRNDVIPDNYDILSDSYYGSHGFLIPDGNPEDLVTVYRGVHPTHPDYPNAVQGKSLPWGGHSSPERHNLGENQSEFTSWTTDYTVANSFSESKPGSIILEQQVVRKELVASPDVFLESEVLRLGPTSGAKVLKP